MAANDGFLYYYDLMGLSRSDYRLHFPFALASDPIQNIATDSGNVGSWDFSGQFYSRSGAGMMTGQKISLSAPSGLSGDNWTHLIVFDKITGGRGVLFDSLSTGLLWSGYTLGVNDANKLYFESYDQNGYSCRTSNIMLGQRNCVAFVKSDETLSFYAFDAPHNSILSDSFNISAEFTRFSQNIAIGRGLDAATYPANAYVDDYVYLSDGLNPSALLALMSGLFSTVVTGAGPVTSVTRREITGYSTGQYMYSGVTGYVNIITGSGQNPFGIWEYQYQTVPLTGLIATGAKIVTPLTGDVVYSFTGDATTSVVFDDSLVTGMTLNEVSFIRKLYPSSDRTFLLTSTSLRTGDLNLVGSYDAINARFQLDDIYTGIQAYLNGQAGFNLGTYPTGIGYYTGYGVSGTYSLTGFYAEAEATFLPSDAFFYDVLPVVSGNGFVWATNPVSGSLQPTMFISSSQHVFLNGVLLRSGVDYNISGGAFRWWTNDYSGASGVLSSCDFPPSANPGQTGLYFSPSAFQRTKSQVFLNGQRQLLNLNYIENHTFDLIGQTGLFEMDLSTVYNNSNSFFE